MDFDTKYNLIKGPVNYCNIAEAKMHDGVAGYFAKVAEKHPTAAKLGAIPVCLLTLATKPLFAIAKAVEAVVRLLFNFAGSIFSAKCRQKLGESLCGVVHYGISLALAPLLTIGNTALNTIISRKDPILYKKYTEAKVALAMLSMDLLNNLKDGVKKFQAAAKVDIAEPKGNHDELYNITQTNPAPAPAKRIQASATAATGAVAAKTKAKTISAAETAGTPLSVILKPKHHKAAKPTMHVKFKSLATVVPVTAAAAAAA